MKYKIISVGFCLFLLCSFAKMGYSQKSATDAQDIVKAECLADLVITQNVLDQENKTIQASKTLKVSNIVFKGGTATYQAGERIVLSGFQAKGGSRAIFRIAPCSGSATNAKPNARSSTIEDVTTSDLRLYPNPTGNSFVIALPPPSGQQKASNQLVEVYNLLGTSVLKKNVKPGEKIVVDLTNKPKGAYLVKYVTNGEVIIKKVIYK